MPLACSSSRRVQPFAWRSRCSAWGISCGVDSSNHRLLAGRPHGRHPPGADAATEFLGRAVERPEDVDQVRESGAAVPMLIAAEHGNCDSRPPRDLLHREVLFPTHWYEAVTSDYDNEEKRLIREFNP